MTLKLLAIDLGKRSFHLYGIDPDGVILSRKVSRAKLAEVVGNLEPTAIAMEACASAHYWARCLARRRLRGAPHQSSFREALCQGFEERCSRRGGDLRSGGASDVVLRAGEVDRPAGPAIAASRPRPADLLTDGFDQPYAWSARRIRDRAAAGPWRFAAQAPAAVADADLSDLERAIFGELLDELDDLDRRIGKLDTTMITLCRTNETCRRLAKLPGVGPVVATAIVAAVNDGRRDSLRPRDGSLDRACASTTYDWRQAAVRWHRTTCQPLSQAPADSWRSRRRQPAA